MNPRESVLNLLYPKIMKITSRERAQFDQSLQPGAQVCSYASSDENSGCESSGQRMKVASVAGDQRKEQKGVILEAHKDKKKVHFGTRMDICHLQKCGVRTEVPKVQRPGRAPR